MNLAHWLARQACNSPLRPALFLGRDCVADYGTFWDQARSMAGWLAGQGMAPGDRVAIFMKNVPEYLTIFYGVWAAGGVVVPINAKLHPREAAFIVKDSGACIVFASADLGTAFERMQSGAQTIIVPSDAFDEIRANKPVQQIVERNPEDLAWLFYTSGTTGQPKGVMMTHRMLATMSLCYSLDVDEVRPEDKTLYAAPISHGAGLYNMLHVRVGAGHVFPRSAGFEPAEIFSLSAYFGRVQLFAAPTMVKRMMQAGRETGQKGTGLRTVVYGGGPMYNADIIAAVDHFGPIFVQIYGQGECPMGITALSRTDVADRSHLDWRARLQSVGRAQSAVQVMIGDQQGLPVDAGIHGEIMVRGDTVMPGYWKNPHATSKTLPCGWLMTGDMGYIDKHGYVTMQDRSRDMIISGGSNIYPREVEEVLMMDPLVREASVVGRPHAEWGEEVIAFIVGDADHARLDRLCLDRIARYKRPKAYISIDALPKNNYGKVLKTELRSRLSDTD